MIDLELIGNPIGKIYKNLIEYACENNDIMSFKVITNNINKEKRKQEFKKICEILNKTYAEMEQLYNNREFLDEVYEKVKDEKGMSWERTIKEIYTILIEEKKTSQFELVKEQIIKREMEHIILAEIGKNIFDRKLKETQKTLQKDFLKIEYQKERWDNGVITDKYYYRISERVQQILLQQTSLYDMKFPNCFEDISFFKEEYCWLKTVSHEEICNIYPNDKREIEYLKEMGLDFIVHEG